MKIRPLLFHPLALAITLAAPHVHADSAIWTGAAADNLWASLGNWSTVPDPITPPASVPGTNPGETATFSGIGTVGVNIVVPVIPTSPATTGAVKFLNFSGASSYTFEAQANPALNAITIEDTGAVTMAAGTAAQGTSANPVPLHIIGDATITNSSDTLLFSQISYAGVAGEVLTLEGPGNIQLKTTLGSVSTAGSVVKKGTGTLTMASSNNTNVTGGYTIDDGIVIAPHQNALSNRNLILNKGLMQLTTNSASSYTGVAINGNFTLSLGGDNNRNQWNRNTAGGALGQLTSSNSPVFTIQTVPVVSPAVPTTSYLLMGLDTSLFSGTFKIGGSASGGGLMISQTFAANNPNVSLQMGEAGVVGEHIAGNDSGLVSNGKIVPIVFGELKGANTGAKLAGRRTNGPRTTGTRYEIGAMGTDTSYSGAIVDGVDSKGPRQMNGNPDCTTSAAPDVTTAYSRGNGVAGSQGTVEFVKTGAGTLTLLSDSTHTGGTVIQGGKLAITSDGALGAAYDGSLRPFVIIGGGAVYANADLPVTQLTGGNPTMAAAIGLFSSVSGNNNNNNLFISFSSQDNDLEVGNITNTETGAGYVSIPTVSFSGGTMSTVGTPPNAEVRVKGLLTLDGGGIKTNAGITSNRAVVLTANGGTFDCGAFDSTLSGILNGAGGLTKTGTGKLTLSGANTHGGATVNQGTLAVSGTALGGTYARLAIATGGVVEPTGIVPVGTLSVGGVQKVAGTYGTTASGAANPDDTHFLGGLGSYVTVAFGSLYSTWAGINAPGQTPSQDNDNDGVPNGVEYFMGQTGSSFTPLPAPVGGKITWAKDPNYMGTYVIQTSGTMADGSWTTVPANSANLKDNGTSVEYTLPTGQGKIFARLVVVPQ